MAQKNALRAVVIGAGWAGEGHTIALREAGVEVEAIVGRSAKPAKERAVQLGIPNVRFDWQEALEAFRPDIVAIATPAKPHSEIAVRAAQMGMHILCEKPLGLNAIEAQQMLHAVQQAGVKHAYAATHRYHPMVLYARKLLADGIIGQVREITAFNTFALPSNLPSTWLSHSDQGGGALFNVFPHMLAQIQCATQAEVVAAAGETRYLNNRVAKGFEIHDFRQLFSVKLDPNQVTDWEEADADTGFTAMMTLKMPGGTEANCLLYCSAQAIGSPQNGILFFGTAGTLHIDWTNTIKRFDQPSKTWEAVEIPQAFLDPLTNEVSDIQRFWNQLVREFTVDIRGEGNAGYPTFYDGWLANQVIDIVRLGQRMKINK